MARSPHEHPRLDILLRLMVEDFSSRRKERKLRFAFQWPGNPVASTRIHGVPRRDNDGRVHVSVAGETAGSAPEVGLALARLPVHVPARAATLRGVRRRYLLDPTGGFILKPADQQAPARLANFAVQPGLLPDVLTRAGTGTYGRGERRYLAGLKTGVSTPRF